MDKFRNWVSRIMYGRYGVDTLGYVMMWGSVILMLISGFTKFSILGTIAFVTLIFAYFRIFSRNVTKRYEENEKFMGLVHRFTGFFTGFRRKAKDKDHCYFRCPSCHQQVRVPKGKGNIEIRCPKCSTRFQKRT